MDFPSDFTDKRVQIPFCCIQFPLYERLKLALARYRSRTKTVAVKDLPSTDAAVCGSIAGAIAAAITTPLDVAKTRIMLSTKSALHSGYSSTLPTVARVFREEGVAALFSGVTPRVLWIGFGGAVFLGVYDFSLKLQRGQAAAAIAGSSGARVER